MTSHTLEVVFDSNRNDARTPLMIDVNGDGLKESIESDEGFALTINPSDGASRPAVNETTDYNEQEFWGEESSLITHNGAVYTLSSGSPLSALFHYGTDLKARLSCVFRQTEKGYAALTPYEIYLARSESKNIDPMLLAIQHKDMDALKLLVNHGHDLNRNRGPDSNSYLGDAIFLIGSQPRGEGFISTLLDMGASPGAESDKNYQNPMFMALTIESPSLIKLLIDRGAYIYSPYHNPAHEIIERFKNHDTREYLLLLVTKRREVIDSDTLLYAVRDNASSGFLRELVETGLPLEGSSVMWLNGERVDNDPFIIELARARKDSGEALALLARLKRQPPVLGKQVNIAFRYETDAMDVHITRIANTNPIPLYNAKYEKALMNFSTSICMHLIGTGCGSEEMKSDATKWLDALPVTCPSEYLKSFDPPVCKLAVYWVQVQNYGIFMRDKTKPDPNDKAGTLRSLRAFTELGSRSLLQRKGRLGLKPL